jgi:fructose-1,6-bisphosphatase/inositol monophosphatase family enzyme
MDLSFMKELALAAGQIGMKHFGRVRKRYKPDRSIVTDADLEIEAFLVEHLSSRYPKHGILAEETLTSISNKSSYVWAVDPVDGTQPFSSDFPLWSISIGFRVEGIPTMGVIYQPAIGDIYYGDPQGVFLNNRQLLPIEEAPLDEHSYFMVPESMHSSYVCHWKGDFLTVGSIAAHCCYVARGCAVGMLARAHIWDLAAGVALMEPLGIRSHYLDGSDVTWTELYDGRRLPQPMLAARKSHWHELAASILSWGNEK